MRTWKAALPIILILVLVMPSLSAAEDGNLFVEDFSGDLSRWTNPELDADSGTADAGCGIWSIEEGALRQMDDATSFAYLSPDRLQAKDFSVSVRMKFLKLTEDGNLWFGISVRKDSLTNEARYNGCNNVMAYFFQNGKVGALRGYPGGQLVDLTTDIVVKNEADTSPGYHEYRLVAQGPLYSFYQDGVLLFELTYEKLQDYGFVSFNSCIAQVELDDVRIEGMEENPLQWSAALPTPTRGPTSTPYPSPTPRPTRTPTPVPGPSSVLPLAAGLGGGLALLAVVLLLLLRRKKTE